MEKYNVAIIGCGSIGAMKEDKYDSPTTEAVLTHAHAFSIHPRTKITALADEDYHKQKQAQVKWSVEQNCDSADIVVVSTPTETHKKILLNLFKVDTLPKLVIAEKPFCMNLKEAEEVSDAYKQANVPILVDYIRRFDMVTAFTLNKLKAGDYGKIYHARCLYGRGLKRDGCHAVDIFNWVFGDVQNIMYNHQGIIDHLPIDPSYTVRLEYKTCNEVWLVATDSRAWGCFEIDFITEKGVLRFTNWGKEIKIYSPEEETTFGQYKALSPSSHVFKTNLQQALWFMADNAVKYLDGEEKLLCTDTDALKVHSIINDIGGMR